MEPFQKSKGGPIIAFQVENEYGDYTNQDRDHLPWLKQLMEKYLAELLFLSDGGHVIREYVTFMNAAEKWDEAYEMLINYKVGVKLFS